MTQGTIEMENNITNYQDHQGIKDLTTLGERLLLEINEIEAQLGNRNLTINGVRLSSHQYHQWRSEAIALKNQKTMEYKRVKRQIQDSVDQEWANNGPQVTLPADLAERLQSFLLMVKDEFDLEPDEALVVNETLQTLEKGT